MKKDIKETYLMATIASNKSGDLSRDIPSLCVVASEDEENYYGNWTTGFGFCDVKFPKKTTRELTAEEIEKYHGLPTFIGDCFGPTINITGKEDFYKKVVITKVEDGIVREGTLISPIKVGRVIAMINETNGKTFRSSTIESIIDNKVKTKNSTYEITYL